ncbi:MAG: hypothetical protein AAB536_01530 [Patescibacteria group bacterium]
MSAPKPFHEAIVLQVNSTSNWVNQSGRRDHNTRTIDVAVLSALADIVQSSVIPANHDAIHNVFEQKFRDQGLPGRENLFTHIAAEKTRCTSEYQEARRKKARAIDAF